MKRIRLQVLILFLLFQPLAAFGQGLFQVEVYEPEEYGNFRQNWAAVQDSSGLMFFANSAGLVGFDGVRWTSTHDPAGEVILSLHAHRGNIHWGGIGEFGIIRADTLNRFGPHSLKSRIDTSHHNFSTVWQMVSDGDAVHHEIPNGIYSFAEDSVRVLPTEERVLGIFQIHGKVLVQIHDQGLFYLESGKLTPISAPEAYSDNKIYVALPADEGWLLVSREQGMVRYNGMEFQPLNTRASDYLRSEGVYRGIELDGNRYAFATLRGGIAITDRNGNLLQTITEENGLHTNQTTHLYLDSEQTLWVTTEFGIAKVLIHNPVTVYNEENGFEGSPTFMESWDGETIIGTTAGLFRLDRSGALSRFPNSEDRFLDAVKIDESLYITAAGGVYQMNNGEITQLQKRSYDFFSGEPGPSGEIYGISGTTMDRIQFVDARLIAEPVLEMDSQISAIFVDSGSIWLALLNGDIVHVDPNDMFQNRYELDMQDEEHINQMGALNGRVVAATDNGLYYFNERLSRFEPDSTFPDVNLNRTQVYRFQECGRDEIWFRNDRKIKRANRRTGSWEVTSDPYGTIARDEGMEVIHCSEDGSIIFGGSRNLYHLSDPDWEYTHTFNTNITGVYLPNDSLVYGGYGEPADIREFSYAENDVRFRFAAASYIEPEANQYRVRLRGYEEEWSSWSDEPQKDYTFIPEGTYTFEVQGKNIYQAAGSIDSYTFTILPPWYRTVWAYIGYLILAGGVLYGGYRIRINALLREQRIRDGIARDLHDELSSTLSSINFFADAIESKKLDKKEEDRFLDLITKSSREAKEKISDIVWVIHTDNDDWENLLLRCRRFAADLLDSRSITHHFKTVGEFAGKPSITERKNIWLIFREVLTNIARHANPQNVDILFRMERGRLMIRIEDDGKGFDTEADQQNGYGLLNIRERAEQLNGTATLESMPGEGTRWRVEVPVNL